MVWVMDRAISMVKRTIGGLEFLGHIDEVYGPGIHVQWVNLVLKLIGNEVSHAILP